MKLKINSILIAFVMFIAVNAYSNDLVKSLKSGSAIRLKVKDLEQPIVLSPHGFTSIDFESKFKITSTTIIDRLPFFPDSTVITMREENCQIHILNRHRNKNFQISNGDTIIIPQYSKGYNEVYVNEGYFVTKEYSSTGAEVIDFAIPDGTIWRDDIVAFKIIAPDLDSIESIQDLSDCFYPFEVEVVENGNPTMGLVEVN